MAQSILKLTHQEAVIKVWGDAETTETIDISDLAASGQELIPEGTPVVNIISATWSGENETVIAVERDILIEDTPTPTNVMTLPATGSSTLYFDGQTLPPETTGNNTDISVEISGGKGELWLKLRKVDGYRTTIEPEQFGPYDDPTVAGA